MNAHSTASANLDVACHINVLLRMPHPAICPRRCRCSPRSDTRGWCCLRWIPQRPTWRSPGCSPIRGVAPITIAGGQAGEADVSSADADERAAGAAALRRIVDLTVALGGDQMNGVPYGLFGPPGGPTSREAVERSAREVGAVADYAHERGITMTFEVLNRYETSLVNTAAQAVAYVEMSGSEHLRIHLDTFHMAVEEADIAEAIRIAMPMLGYLELGQSGRGLLSTEPWTWPRS